MKNIFKLCCSEIEGLKRLDAEYYQPKYRNITTPLLNYCANNKLSSICKIQTGPAYSSKSFDKNNGIKISKIGDITNKRDVDNWDCVSYEEFLKYQSKCILKGSILMTMTGDPPDVGKTFIPYTEFDKDSTLAYNQRIAIIQSLDSEIDNYYLYAFFSTEYYRLRIEQVALGIRQRNISINDIRKSYIFIPENKRETENISKLIENHLKIGKQSKDLYNQATKLLEQKLELDKIEFEKKKSFTANFSEIVENNRCDSDYYKNEYRQIEQHIKDFKTISLSSLCFMNKGIEVGSNAYTDEGKLFIRVSNLDINGFKVSNSDKYISQDYYDSLKAYEPQENDILLTKDGTVGTCYVVDEKIEGIISGAIVKLSLKTQDIEPEYFALAVNSKFCQMQISRECSGALIQHWKPEQIRKLQIPIIDYEKMREISKLVIEAKKAKKQSKLLLEQAKKRVEELIEENAFNEGGQE